MDIENALWDHDLKVERAAELREQEANREQRRLRQTKREREREAERKNEKQADGTAGGPDQSSEARHRLSRQAKRRAELIGHALDAYSDETRDYVTDVIGNSSLDRIKSLTRDEIDFHPLLYQDLRDGSPFALWAVALANVHEGRNPLSPDDLIPLAHVFLFDDEAWWAGHGWDEPLTRLPYRVCITGNVILYGKSDGAIAAMPISPSANVSEAKRLMSFVVNACSRLEGVDSGRTFVSDIQANKRASHPGAHRPSSVSPSVVRVMATQSTIGASDSSTRRAPADPYSRRGHWRNQACGPGHRDHRKVWIAPTIVVSGGKAHKITNSKRVHRVILGGEYEGRQMDRK